MNEELWINIWKFNNWVFYVNEYEMWREVFLKTFIVCQQSVCQKDIILRMP